MLCISSVTVFNLKYTNVYNIHFLKILKDDNGMTATKLWDYVKMCPKYLNIVEAHLGITRKESNTFYVVEIGKVGFYNSFVIFRFHIYQKII